MPRERWFILFSSLAAPNVFLSIYLTLFAAEMKRNLKKVEITFNGGSLGSCIDEERSQVR